jgi:antitoxin component of RelBE/YafQ-DinJ toxin-antitoxin module
VKNLTLSIDEHLLTQSRDHARRLGKSLNQFVRDLLAQTVRGETDPFEEMIELADKMQLCSESGPLTREEAHERG